mmetsp:Transcript_21377/g.21707  ORF Transcript_21377/g.21707 Transcript_21377/m.21707 type:complete len:305 (-) Transcript_21377:91-1005(-)
MNVSTRLSYIVLVSILLFSLLLMETNGVLIDSKSDNEKRQEEEEKALHDAMGQQQQQYTDAPPDENDEDFSAAEVISSPHDSRGIDTPLLNQQCNTLTEKPACLGGSMPCVDNLENLLDAQHLVTKSLKSITQKDTLHKVSTSNILNVRDVPIYHFQQPGRISPQQLPFSLVLFSQLDRVSRQEILVADKSQSEDSWFLGHYWSPVVVCACELSCKDNNATTINTIPKADRFLHIGWKFSSLDIYLDVATNDGIEEASFFYALIIQPKRNDLLDIKRLEIVGFKAPTWMLLSLKNGTFIKKRDI